VGKVLPVRPPFKAEAKARPLDASPAKGEEAPQAKLVSKPPPVQAGEPPATDGLPKAEAKSKPIPAGPPKKAPPAVSEDALPLEPPPGLFFRVESPSGCDGNPARAKPGSADGVLPVAGPRVPKPVPAGWVGPVQPQVGMPPARPPPPVHPVRPPRLEVPVGKPVIQPAKKAKVVECMPKPKCRQQCNVLVVPTYPSKEVPFRCKRKCQRAPHLEETAHDCTGHPVGTLIYNNMPNPDPWDPDGPEAGGLLLENPPGINLPGCSFAPGSASGTTGDDDGAPVTTDPYTSSAEEPKVKHAKPAPAHLADAPAQVKAPAEVTAPVTEAKSASGVPPCQSLESFLGEPVLEPGKR